MANIERSALKLKREIKKVAMSEQREVSHQHKRFTTFFEGFSSPRTIQLVPRSEGEAFKRSLFRDARSVLSLSSKEGVCKNLSKHELKKLGELIVSVRNEVVLLFSIHDYGFPSVLLPVGQFFDNFESILNLMENEVVIVFDDMLDALSFNNEDTTVGVSVFGNSFPL